MSSPDWSSHAIGGFTVRMGWTRRKRGVRRFRFLLLGLAPEPGGFRPLVASGDIVAGVVKLDHGMLALEHKTAIEALAAEHHT